MIKFPRTEVAGVSLPRMLIGTNWILGYSHTGAAADALIHERNDAAESVRDIVNAYLEYDIDAMMGLYANAPHVLDGIHMAEDMTGKKVTLIDTPIIDVHDSAESRRSAEQQIALSAKNGAKFCLIHHSSAEQLVRKVDHKIDRLSDYTDMVRSARSYIETQPEYISAYFAGGYPPEGQGVCTDVIWRALKAAGYDFKAMLDADVSSNPSAYPLPNGTPDSNIDFRRVVNLRVYFDRCCQALTTDPTDVAQWQPGDIVFYEGHVAVVSDRRNAAGQPWIIHHTGHGAFEEDALTYRPILAHYRWTVE